MVGSVPIGSLSGTGTVITELEGGVRGVRLRLRLRLLRACVRVRGAGIVTVLFLRVVQRC